MENDIFDKLIFLFSYFISYIIVGYAENILLIKEERGVKFRLNPARFKPYLSREWATVLATIQLLIPVGLSLLLDSFLNQLVKNLGFFIIPFVLLFGVIVYFGEITEHLPYNVSRKEKVIGLLVVVVSIVILLSQFEVIISTLKQYNWIPH